MIAGHLDTSDLDPVTARAVEILTAADMLSAAQRMTEAPRQRTWVFRHSWSATVVLALLSLVMLAFGYLRIASLAQQNHTLQTQNHQLITKIDSCVDPKGKCYKDGQNRTAQAVTQIVSELAVVACTVASPPHDNAAVRRCVANVRSARP